MKKLVLLGLTAALACGYTPAVHAQSLGDCAALTQSEAYGEDFDDYKMLVEGADQWVFRTVQDMRRDYTISREELPVLQRFVTTLKAKDIDFLIAFTPTRGMTAAKYLPTDNPLTKDFDPEQARKSYIDHIAEMNKNGIPVVGTPDADPDYFYKADHHWTTHGAQKMARAVADFTKKKSLTRGVRKQKFITKTIESADRDGRFNIPIEKICGFKLPPEKSVYTETIPEKEASDQDALFGDQKPPEVVLVGTSNSIQEKNDFNFSGYLKEYLETDVYNAAISGGGLGDSLLAYLASDSFRTSPPKLIIWEIPGYYDLTGDAIEKILRQGIPAIWGDCGKDSVAGADPVELGGEETVILKDLAAANIRTGDVYLSLSFPDAVKNHFTVVFNKGENSRESFKFKRTKKYPHDGLFFFIPRADDKRSLANVTLKVPREMIGLKVTPKLCKIPG